MPTRDKTTESRSGLVGLVRRRPWTTLSLTVLLAIVLTVLLDDDLRPQSKQGVRAITEGKVYQSGALSDSALEKAVKRHHLRTVIDLRKPPDDDPEKIEHEGEVLAALGVDHVRLPAGQVPLDSTVDQFLEVMSDPSSYPVLIHCHHGFGRSVLFSALYRIEFEGWDNEAARHATRHFLRLPFSSFDDEEEKGAYLKNYVPRHHPSESDAAGGPPATQTASFR